MAKSKRLLVTAEKINLEVLEPSRKALRNGDLFVLRPRGRPYQFGRIIRTDADVIGAPAILIYIYKAASEEADQIPPLSAHDLLVPPIMTNRLPWRRGYFRILKNIPLTRFDVLPVHSFRDQLRPEYYFNEVSKPLAKSVAPVGDFGVHSFLTIDDAISDALGLPRADS